MEIQSIMRAVAYILGSGFLGVALMMTGCSTARLMMPTPNVHLDTGRDYYANLAPELQDTEVPLFYITDRAPEQDEEGRLRYGYRRSASLAFGTAVVDLGMDITWDELLEASRYGCRSGCAAYQRRPSRVERQTADFIIRTTH